MRRLHERTALAKVLERFKAIVKAETGMDFPQDPREQLMMAVAACSVASSGAA